MLACKMTVHLKTSHHDLSICVSPNIQIFTALTTAHHLLGSHMLYLQLGAIFNRYVGNTIYICVST